MLAWGTDGEDYIGRQMTLFREPTVLWGGQEEGGIRISYLSHLEKDLHFMLTLRRGKKVPYTIKMLEVEERNVLPDETYEQFCTDMKSATNMAVLQDIGKRVKDGFFDKAGSDKLKKQYAIALEVIRACDE